MLYVMNLLSSQIFSWLLLLLWKAVKILMDETEEIVEWNVLESQCCIWPETLPQLDNPEWIQKKQPLNIRKSNQHVENMLIARLKLWLIIKHRRVKQLTYL